MVKYVQSCLYLLFCPTDLNVCFYDSTMILFYFFKKITISLRYSMESDRVIPPAFLLLRLLVFFFFETRSHCVFFAGLEFTDWNLSGWS